MQHQTYDNNYMGTARETALTGEAFFRINRKTSALLIIDMQNAFLEPGAMLKTPTGRDIITRLSRLVTEYRKLEVPIIWIRLDDSAPYGGLLLDKYPRLREQRVLTIEEVIRELHGSPDK
ncbi:MAG: isochorismatase family protein [Gammaproteobacteria bacterium]|nr:isochorismatase family protein [Gammaproteobacteria bacterium]